ncbi:hypothetical protein AGMMS50284_2320 [Clostridia bacterium]|nr:hypothetical protein AGMMS50284_2320 [Clostridia bacterium]
MVDKKRKIIYEHALVLKELNSAMHIYVLLQKVQPYNGNDELSNWGGRKYVCYKKNYKE